MAIVDAAPIRAVQHQRNDRRAWLALGLAVLGATSCVVALVLPYYAAGRPARESLYLYDIDALWPYTSAAGPLVGLLSFWALAMAPVHLLRRRVLGCAPPVDPARRTRT